MPCCCPVVRRWTTASAIIKIGHTNQSTIGRTRLIKKIVALDGTGKPAFYDLMKRQCQAVYYAFDILWLNGRDLRNLSLLDQIKIGRGASRTPPCGTGVPCRLSRNYLKDQREGPVIFVSPRTGAASRRPTT